MRRILSFVSGLSLLALALAYGCSDDESTFTRQSVPGDDSGTTETGTSTPTDSGGGGDSATGTKKAKATLAATGLPDSGTPTGTVEIEDDGTQATVKITVGGATDGYHGAHIHAVGDCANNDAGFGGAAGGHWNPTDAGHGFPMSPTHHAGDLGNILVTGGTGGTSVTTTTIKLADGDALNPIGKAVIFHQGTDDGTTQPTGDAGTRAACGILQKN
jgi:superoxide dismutase, Cu-Zn family